MAFIKWFIDFILILIVQLFVCHVACEESDDVYYVAQFNDQITECEDFENEVFICENMGLTYISEGDGGYTLSGQLKVKKPITDDMVISIIIYKDAGFGKEFMYSVEGNVCDSLKEEDTPWYPLVSVFNSTDCPIDPDVFNLNGIDLSLDFAKDVLRYELCGDYIIKLEFQTGSQQTISCYNIPVEVLEKYY